jgi:cell division control protein 45
MILQIDDWYLGYDQIVKDALGSEVGSVWILVNADVDALAAARIMTYMLRSDCIPYQLRPCWSYSSLTNLLKSEESSEIRSLVLLNLGSSRNLTYLFDENMLMDTARVYVMDCRKPVHLANIHGGDQIVVFWDETQNLDELPSDGDNLSGHASTTEEEEGSSDDGEESDGDELEDDPDEGETEFEIDTVIKDADESVDLNYDGEDEEDIVDDQEEVMLRKRSLVGFSKDDKQKRLKATGKDNKSIATEEESDSASHRDGDALLPTLTPRELHEKRRNRLRTYYAGGSFYGSPVAWIAYRLATQKRWNDNGDLLWLACVGLTDAYLHARIDVAGFASLSVDLKTCCQRIFPNEMVDRIDKVIYAENLSGKDKQNQTQVTVSENGKVIAETDFRFFLLRHSSLFDSMIYSNYVASRLQVWTSQGKQKLQEMLAKMGIPLNECRQPYAFMNPNLKRKLRDKFREFAEVRHQNMF